MVKRVYLYALNDVFRIVDTKFLEGDAISIRNILRLANLMRDTSNEKVDVYAVDNRIGLYKDYMESVKSKDFSDRVCFADLVSKEGIFIN